MAIGAAFGLIFGAVGLCAAIGLLAAMGGLGLVASYSAGGITASTVGLIVAAWLGGRLAPRMASSDALGASGLGCVVAIASLEIGTLAGSVYQLITSGPKFPGLALSHAINSFVVKPMVWVSFFGVWPAVMLGACFGLIVRQTLRGRVAANTTG